MSIQRAIFDQLQAEASITALVGTRVFPVADTTQARTLPCIIFHKVSNRHVRHTEADAGMAESRFQFDCLADDPEESETVYDATRKVFDGFTLPKAMGTAPNTVTVFGSFVDDDSEDYFPPSDGKQSGVFRNRVDVNLTYAESIPPA